jgi:hypothetical protein
MNDFCMAPWTHTYISPQGERRLCCASREPAQNFKQYIDTEAGSGEFNPLTLKDWWNSEHVRTVRSQWLQGQIPDACEVCDKKLLNTDVYKDYFGHLFADLRQQAIDSTDSTGFTTMQPVSWDYRYSNICNFKCRMCGDMLSSSWESEAINNNMVDLDNPKNNWLRQDNRQLIKDFVSNTVVPEFMSAVESRSIREIYWVGGEPLLYPQHWQAMSRIIDLGYADQVRIRYNTNLSQINYKNQNLYAILKNYKNWEICASLDGIGSIGQYIRTGLVYNDWLSNFKMGMDAQKHPHQMRIDFTLTLPGMVQLVDVIHLADSLGSQLLCKVIFAFSPNILLSPLALPRDLLDAWIQQIQTDIGPIDNRNKQTVNDMLEQLKKRPTFAQQYGQAALAGATSGKQHILKLESIRSETKIKMSDILSEYKPALEWWNSI